VAEDSGQIRFYNGWDYTVQCFKTKTKQLTKCSSTCKLGQKLKGYACCFIASHMVSQFTNINGSTLFKDQFLLLTMTFASNS